MKCWRRFEEEARATARAFCFGELQWNYLCALLAGLFVGFAAYLFLGTLFPFSDLPLQELILAQQTHRDTFEASRVIFCSFVLGGAALGFIGALVPRRKP